MAENPERYGEIIAQCEELKSHDTNRFYRGIFWLHVMMGGLAVVLAMNSLTSTTAGLPTVGLSAITFVVFFAGIFLSVTRWNPYKIRNPIEVATLVWEEVLRA